MLPIYLMSTGSSYDDDNIWMQLAECDRKYAEIQQLLREAEIRHNRPEWRAYDASQRIKRRMAAQTGFDDLPAPKLYEPQELYRQRLRKAIADRRARAACLDLRRRLMERGMEHIPLPRDSETPEAYRRRIRTVRNILADRRK